MFHVYMIFNIALSLTLIGFTAFIVNASTPAICLKYTTLAATATPRMRVTIRSTLLQVRPERLLSAIPELSQHH